MRYQPQDEFYARGLCFYSAVSETDPVQEDGSQNVFESDALAHVAATIEDLAGDRDPDGFDERTPDTINVPGGVIDYNFNIDAGENGEITFTRDDLLVGAVPQQVTYDNLEVSEVALSEGFTEIGELTFDEATGVYTIALNEGITRADVSGLTVDYQVRDWTAVVDAVATTLDESALTAVDDTAQGDEDTAILGSVADNDTTTSGGTLSYSVNTDLFVAENEDGSFTLSQGVLTLDPEFSQNGQYSFQPNENYNGTDSFSYTVTDSESGERAVQTVTITVDAVNDAPTNLALSASTVAENAAGAVIGTLTSSDVDADDTVTYTVSDERFEVVDGSLKLKDGESLNHEDAASVNVVVTATDSGDLTTNETFTITVSDVNEAPTNLALSASTVAENAAGAVIGTLTSSDVDADDTVTYTVSDERFEVVDGSLKLKDGESLNHEDAASVNVVVTATDSGDLTTNETFTITVSDVNEAPTNLALSASTVAENAAGAVIGTLTSSDVDADDTVTYTVSDERFEVVDGSLKLKDGESLNHEDAASVNVVVTATDSGDLTTNETFTITVSDVNEAPTNLALSASTVAENAAGAVIGTLTSSDVDADDTVTYTVSDERFEVVDGSLKLKDGESLNHEDAASVNVVVTATDSGDLTTNETFTITVSDVNEAPTNLALSASTVAENAAGAVIGTLTSSDVDADDTVTYTVSDERFEVVDGSLKLKDGESLNHEDAASVNVVVTATDSGDLTTNETFTITVSDVNEAPTNLALSASTVAENAAGAVIGTLTSSDVDADDTVTYTVSDERFEVVDGSLKLKDGESLNHEDAASVNVVVTATDSGDLTTNETFTITVSDVNEAPTNLALSASTVAENAAGAVIGTLTSSDVDADDTVTYTVSDERFEVVDGSLKLKDGESLNHEDAASVNVVVTATDSGDLTTNETFTITVSDVNEAPTNLALSASTVAENAAGAVIGTLTSSDVDADDTVTYTVSDERFEVVDGSLKLKDGESLNHEDAASVNVVVTATDSGDLTTNETFTITVSDVNEAPTNLALSASTVAENAAGAVIGTLTSSDVDADDTVTYTVSDERFEVVDGSLKLKDGESLNHEDAASVNVVVTATDSGDLTTNETFTITVSDVNEAPTNLALSASTVAENAAGAVIGTLTSSDVDADDTVTYTVSDERFEVVDGSLKLKDGESLNHEDAASVNVVVTATDSGDLTTNETFTITVSDVNEAPTNLALSASTVAENAAGAVIGTLTSSDVDADDTVTYTVSDERFEVVDGSLKLKDGESLNHEDAASVNVVVTATDSGDLTTNETFTITVSDVNEAPTNLALSASTVAENAAGAVIGTLTSSDVDADDTVTYTVSDERFEVVDGSLKLKDGESLNHEDAASVNVVVTATDSGDLTTNETFTITVSDVNEAPTNLALSASTVAENAAGAVIGTLTSSDVDADDTVTYTVSDERFEVVDGSLKLKDGESLNHEDAASVNVVVTATDSGDLTTNETFTITVSDVNEAPTNLALSASTVAENAAGAVIGTLTSSDVDADDTVTYTVSDERFEVVDGSLKLKDGESLNHEDAASVNVVVTATDSGDLTTNETFTITVSDVNEAPTNLALSASTVAENAAGAVIGTLTSSDVDADDTVTYTVSDERFEVVDGSLKLKDGESLNHEDAASVNVVVTATDSGDLTTNETFTITVSDVNEAPTIAVSANDFTEDAGGLTTSSVAGTYTTFDEDGDTLTVTMASSSHYTLDTANNQVLLTQAGIDVINDGGTLDAIALTVTDDGTGTLSGSASDTPVVTPASNSITISGDTVVLIGTGEKKQGNDDKNDDGVADGLFFDIDTAGTESNDSKGQDDDGLLGVNDLDDDDFRFSTSETLYWTGDADDDGDIETLQVKWDDDDDGKLQGYVEYQDDNGDDKTTDVIKLEMKGDGTVSGEDGFYWKAETKGDGIFSDELATSFVTAETGNPNFLAVSGSGSSTVGLVLSSFEGSTAATVNISSTGASGVKQLAVGGGDLDEGDTLQIEFSDNVTAGGFGTKPSVTTELVNSFSFELVAVTNKGTGEFEVYYQDHNGDWQLDDTYDFSGDSDRTIEVSVTTGMMAIKIVGTDIDSNQGFKVSLDNSSLIESVGDLILDFGVSVLYYNGSEDITSNTAAIKVGIDQTGDSKVMIGTTLIDGIITGMRYETSSGFVGYTDANGALKYNLSDNVTFSVGSVVLGTVAASATMISGKVFLQDIVGVGLENITDDYVEKLAIFLQTLDNDGDAYNGIVITDEMHALFSDDNFDLEAITKEELVQLLLDNGLTPVDEDEAIQHVKDMITEHAGLTEFEEDDNDSISLLGDDEGLDLAWSLSDPDEPVDGMYLSDEADQVSLEIGDLLGDGIPDSDLSQYISVASDGLNTVIEVNSAGIGNTEGGASMSYTLEGVDLTTDTNGNALDTDSMNELLRNLYNGANDTGLM